MPRGGKREGAGRPKGSTSALEYGEVKAIKAAKLRIPEGTPEAHADLALDGLRTIEAVMRGEVHFSEAGPRLKAATHIREEVCGPMKQKVEHSFSNLTEEQLDAKIDALSGSASAAKPPESGE